MGNRFYRAHIPLIDAWTAHGMARLGDHEGALPILRRATDELFTDGQFGYCTLATRLLVEELIF